MANVNPRRRTVVVAPNFQHFRNWCLVDNDPPLDPRDPKFVVLTGAHDARKVMGLRAQDHEFIVLGWPTSHQAEQLHDTLYARAWL